MLAAETLSCCAAGHVWAAAQGLAPLMLDKENFEAIGNSVAFSNDSIRGAEYCAQAEEEPELAGKGMAGMRNMLRSVAERGYAPFKRGTDPRVALGSLRNVWGVVSRSTSAPSVPPEAWNEDPKRKKIVVAASQAMRRPGT